MGRNNKNFTIQLNNRINGLLAIGESKHEAKKEYKKIEEEHGRKPNPSKSNYIHNPNSAGSYRQTVGEFCSWIKENKNDVWSSKELDQVDKNICYEYLKERELSCSPDTISKDMSALNKVLNFDLNKKEGELKERSYKDITRSRLDRGMDKAYNPKNYANQIEFAKAFGLRRESILGGNYQVKDISLFKQDDKLWCSVIEKGGRYREAPCLEIYKDIISEKYDVQERESFIKDSFTQTFTDSSKTEIIYPQIVDKEGFKEFYSKSKSEFLFDKYTSKIDNHAFRGEYARDLYNQIAEQKTEIKSDYKGYDEEIVREVSKALGHNRANVVVYHYLR